MQNKTTVTLSQINCPEEEFLNLERLHYEVVTRERIMSLAMANDTISFEGSFKTYHEEYLAIYKEYDAAKLKLFNIYLSNIENITQYRNWEADFRTKTINLYA